MEKQNPFLQFWQRAWWSKLITVAVGLFIFFIILGIFSPEGKRSAQEGFEAGKKVASESPSPKEPPSTTQSPSLSPKLNLKEDPQKYIDYSSKMEEIFDSQTRASTDLSALLGKWPDLTDSEVISLVADTVVLEQGYDKALAITSPRELISTHSKYLQAYRLVKTAMPIFREGLDNQDATLIEEFSAKMSEATKITQEATQELNLFTESVKN